MVKTTRFLDRKEAGFRLAKQIRDSIDRWHNGEVVILALPRGGVPVAFEIASQLKVPMDVLVVRKLGLPGNTEYAVGALSEEGTRVANKEALGYLPETQWNQVVAKEQLELERRIKTYRSGKKLPSLVGKTVVIVDDGLATGATMLAAVKVVKKHNPKRIIVAVPVGARQTCQEILGVVDEVICLQMPNPFRGVGSWYQSFPQTSDETVVSLLNQAHNQFNGNN